MLAFSNFSHALVAETSKSGGGVAGYKSIVIDHSKQVGYQPPACLSAGWALYRRKDTLCASHVHDLCLCCYAMPGGLWHFRCDQMSKRSESVMHGDAQELSRSEDKRTEVGKSLAAVGAALEKAFKGPQDVEGALVGSEVFIVQTRPQP